MTTFEALWTALRAAERIAEVHGLTVDARIDAVGGKLVVLLRDGASRPVSGVSIPCAVLDAYETPEQLSEGVERDVAGMLAGRPGARAS